jgi:hypothetical protein
MEGSLARDAEELRVRFRDPTIGRLRMDEESVA